MGLIIEWIFDFAWIEFMLRLKQRHPRWFWALIAIQLVFVAGIFALVFYWAR